MRFPWFALPVALCAAILVAGGSASATLARPVALDTPIPGLPAGTGGGAPVPYVVNAKTHKDTRVGIDGVWEVAIQQPDKTVYTHFKLKQLANASTATLTGVYMDNNGKIFPASGKVEGKNVTLTVTLKDGTALVFDGTLDGTTDMIGMLTMGDNRIAFTAGYRPKYNPLDDISPGLGGLGGGGLGAPGGGAGGYPPK